MGRGYGKVRACGGKSPQLVRRAFTKDLSPWNLTKQKIASFLEEARIIVDLVEPEGQAITPAERARAEHVLERVKSLKDGEQLRKAIEAAYRAQTARRQSNG